MDPIKQSFYPADDLHLHVSSNIFASYGFSSNLNFYQDRPKDG